VITAAALAAPVPQPAAVTPDPGALVRTTMRSTVGVLLDDIPKSMRSRVAAAVVARPESFWRERAMEQARLTTYRLVFREFFYAEPKKQLPLPPEPLWQITLLGTPHRTRIDGHDLVAVDYRLSSVLLSDAGTPGISEPALRPTGGIWREGFVLPVDPEQILQRTGFACLDEDSFPFPSVDSEEIDTFYDNTCGVEGSLGNDGQCHYTRFVKESCVEALQKHVGSVSTRIVFERLPWDAALADQYRFGKVTGAEPDLEIYLPDFLPSRITYRYVHADSCEVVEGCVSGTGWRRLLQFATSDENVGEQPVTIGGLDYFVTGHGHENDEHNLFELSACHHHYHFRYYGAFRWQGDAVVNQKNGFCLQSTARAANRETSPLAQDFGGCDYQGVAPGWLDQYKIGLPCQWLDITGFPAGEGTRSFRSNPNGFICEGTFVDQQGQPLAPGAPVVWHDTGLIGENGRPVEAPLCQLAPGWDANDEHEKVETIPPDGQGLVTSPCDRGQLGPARNCGFAAPGAAITCTPGEQVRLKLTIPGGAAPQVARVCEYSHALSSPIPCRAEDTWVPLAPGKRDQPYTLANAVVTDRASTTVRFVCPTPRQGGSPEPGGAFAIYTAPVFPDDAAAPINVH